MSLDHSCEACGRPIGHGRTSVLITFTGASPTKGAPPTTVRVCRPCYVTGSYATQPSPRK